MSVDLEDKLAAMGIMNAPAYAKKFAEDEWTWEALVGCSDEKLDVLVQRVGMKEGSALTFKGRVRDAREQARLAPAAPAPDDAHQSPPAWKSTGARRGRPVAPPSSGEAPASPSPRRRTAPRTVDVRAGPCASTARPRGRRTAAAASPRAAAGSTASARASTTPRRRAT
jgi:hypothetical protein